MNNDLDLSNMMNDIKKYCYIQNEKEHKNNNKSMKLINENSNSNSNVNTKTKIKTNTNTNEEFINSILNKSVNDNIKSTIFTVDKLELTDDIISFDEKQKIINKLEYFNKIIHS